MDDVTSVPPKAISTAVRRAFDMSLIAASPPFGHKKTALKDGLKYFEFLKKYVEKVLTFTLRGNGYISSYSINLGVSEVKECGFIDEDGNPLPIEKYIDTENNQIIIRIKAGD